MAYDDLPREGYIFYPTNVAYDTILRKDNFVWLPIKVDVFYRQQAKGSNYTIYKYTTKTALQFWHAQILRIPDMMTKVEYIERFVNRKI